jgi:two-component system response regulator AtoC
LVSTLSAAQFQTAPLGAGVRKLEPEPDPNPNIVTVDAGEVWRGLLARAAMVAPHLQLAVIEGEPGVGKATLARYLHSRAAIDGETFERHDAREWLTTPASSGFVYLDRIDLLGPAEQALLLGRLKSIQDRTLRHTVLVASSEASLRQMVTRGKLLPDLAFRLTAARFPIPPLRQRRNEIVPLALAMLDRLCSRYHLRPVVLGSTVPSLLQQHNWPGNVRELSSTLESALLEAADGVIHAENLPILTEAEPPSQVRESKIESLNLDNVVRQHIHYVLDLNHGNKLRTARHLGISRSTLYRILGGQPDSER